MGGGFLYCSMTLWIFSHKTFGSSTLGICRVTKDIHIKEGTTNYSQLFRPPQRRQDPPSIPSKNIGQRVKTTSDHLEWLRSRKETRLYRPTSSPIPVPVKNRRKEDLRFLLYEWHWGREGGSFSSFKRFCHPTCTCYTWYQKPCPSPER